LAPPELDVVLRRELAGLAPEQLDARVDELQAAIFILAADDERRRRWPATVEVLECEVERRVAETLRSSSVEEPLEEPPSTQGGAGKVDAALKPSAVASAVERVEAVDPDLAWFRGAERASESRTHLRRH
jgi:hypothetical protein